MTRLREYKSLIVSFSLTYRSRPTSDFKPLPFAAEIVGGIKKIKREKESKRCGLERNGNCTDINR